MVHFSNLELGALIFSSIAFVHAQTVPRSDGQPGSSSQYEKGRSDQWQGSETKGERSKKGTDMDRRGDDSSTDRESRGGSVSGSGSGSGGPGSGSDGSGAGGGSGGGGSKY